MSDGEQSERCATPRRNVRKGEMRKCEKAKCGDAKREFHLSFVLLAISNFEFRISHFLSSSPSFLSPPVDQKPIGRAVVPVVLHELMKL